MQLSDKTLTILKNFASINASILLKKGNVLRTMSPQKTVLATAKIDEDIPQEAGVYDVARFISALSLYENPEITFEDKYFSITEGKRKTKYVYTEANMIIAPPDKEITLPEPDLEIDVDWNDLQTVIKATGIFQLPEIAFVGDGEKVFIRAFNSSDPTTDTVGVELGETEDKFTLILKVENIKLLPGDYHVSLSSKGISSFEAGDVKYMIAVDAKSSYVKAKD